MTVDDPLDSVRAALAAMSDDDLDEMHRMAQNGSQLSRPLLAFLAHGSVWELSRRAGQSFELHLPQAAIGAQERDFAFLSLGQMLVDLRKRKPLVALLTATAEALHAEPANDGLTGH